jgi:hypothetical protein
MVEALAYAPFFRVALPVKLRWRKLSEGGSGFVTNLFGLGNQSRKIGCLNVVTHL